MRKSDILGFLEAAQKYQKRHPDLMIGFAIGLTALDHAVAVQHAVILDGYNVFKGCPDGISKDEYKLIQTHYVSIHDNLTRYGLYAAQETLSSMIDALRRQSAG